MKVELARERKMMISSDENDNGLRSGHSSVMRKCTD